MQAEHRFMAGPTRSPFRDPLMPRLAKPWEPESRKRKTSVAPATKKAKVIPTVTRRRYAREKSHHRDSRVLSGSDSKQKPWKHSAFGEAAAARSASTVSSLGSRLKVTNRTSSTAKIASPTTRLFLRPVSKMAWGKPPASRLGRRDSAFCIATLLTQGSWTAVGPGAL